MPKQCLSNYEHEVEAQRTAWERKPARRSVYRSWCSRIVDQLSPAGSRVEIGG